MSRHVFEQGSVLGACHRLLARKAYSWGLASGSMIGWEGGKRTSAIFWRGKRCYFLGWPRWKWRCVLKRHHWPTSYTVLFDLCGKCLPWPCCGAITIEHAEGCTGVDPA